MAKDYNSIDGDSSPSSRKESSRHNLDKEGRLTIPKKLRKDLGIDENTLVKLEKKQDGVYLYPLKKEFGANKSYSEILKETQGSWAQD